MTPENTRAIFAQARSIKGWLMPEAAALFGLLDEIQQQAGITGHLFEIGVHHGRSAVLLCALARDDERFGACDLFGAQGLNVSDSGSGDRAAFEGNLARVVPGFTRVDVFQNLSSDLTPAQIGGGYRIFHVDGGHLAEEALADCLLAAEVLDPRGAIIVDDPYRVDWPGVTEGILRFLADRPEFTTLVVGFNKQVLVRRDALNLYTPAITGERLWDWLDRRAFATKAVPIAGGQATAIFIPADQQLAGLDRVSSRLQWHLAEARTRSRQARHRIGLKRRSTKPARAEG